MGLPEEFAQAVADSKTLAAKPDNQTLLQLYSLYKQATEGDIRTDPPENPFDIVGRAKYEAWKSLSGKGKDSAMQEYIDLVKKLKS